ncbi:uncharacterized protein LOC114317321 [Camellia sinensis]|uniref:uncharacterized protein LOC114317321 n=1 Tax=Camellia sinensis TaxID=4442 RepID=UPI001036308E|nr:uncharacterized protein LOC114317321 [Camellia sinensis]
MEQETQYIADQERTIQVLQAGKHKQLYFAERSEVSATLEFRDQKNLILGMENRVVRQRLDGLSQEHMIKHLEQDVLEREITRLRTLCQLHQHQNSKHRRNKTCDLDPQFASFSIKNQEADPGTGSVGGSAIILI